jgi:hypothetical protein
MALEPQRSRKRERTPNPQVAGKISQGEHVPAPDSWTEVLGSERLTGATLDRLTHRCRIIETKGESYRLRDAKGRRRTTKEDAPLDQIEGPEAD